MITDLLKYEQNAQQSDPPPQPGDLQLPDSDREMRPVWELYIQEEHLAITRRAHELSEAHGSEHGCDRKDWFRAELELHLYE